MASNVVLSGERPTATIAGLMRRGEVRRIAPGVYTTDVDDAEGAVTREWRKVVGHLLAGSVITDRSGPTGGPVGGVLYLARAAKERVLRLPGLVVAVRRGAGAIDGDIALPGGLYQASRWRALAENTRPSRAAHARPARTLTDAELAEWVDRLVRVDGEGRLVEYRDRAELEARRLGVPPEGIGRLAQLVGAAVGTKAVQTGSAALAARQRGAPYDPDRLAAFGRLVEALRRSAPQHRPAEPDDRRWAHLPFFEAYFSNYIEGTEFSLPDAVAVVYQGATLAGRSADSHDLTGTYRIVADPAEMASQPAGPEQFLDTLRHRHSVIMAGRPERRPGRFKTVANQAGQSLFVPPELVEGTLRASFEPLAGLDTAWERAVYIMFVVSEVHPFEDGNGRVARVMMNAELVAGGQARIIIPTVFRDDYLGGLRRLTRSGDPNILIKALRFAHDYTAMVDFADLAEATDQLVSTNAFNDPDSVERLRLPGG